MIYLEHVVDTVHYTHRGYQQCIANVVTNFVGNKLPGGVGYRVDEGTMQRLQVLLQDGKVDKWV